MIDLSNILPEIYFESSELPSLPPPTLCYGLMPYGVGTVECESLKSYICRLADEHRVSLKSFFKHVVSTEIKTGSSALSNPYTCSLRNSTYAITMGNIANDLVVVLNKVTGKSILEYCTLLPLINVISTNNLFSIEERHCPKCLLESDSKMYGHLLWAVECVNVCPKHKIYLVPSKCGNHDAKQLNAIVKKTLWGVCSSCGSIGYRCRKDDPIIATDIDIWKAQEIGNLISLLPTATNVFSKINLIKGLNLLTIMVADGKSAILARQAGINKSVLWGWIHGYYLPSLPILLKLCLSAKVSLASVLSGSPITCDTPLYENPMCKTVLAKPTLEIRERGLRKALISYPAKSLAEVSRELGISSAVLIDKFPSLTSKLVENYKIFIATQKNDREKQIQEYGKDIMQELVQNGLSLSLRNFQKFTGKVAMPNTALRNFWEEYRIAERKNENPVK